MTPEMRARMRTYRCWVKIQDRIYSGNEAIEVKACSCPHKQEGMQDECNIDAVR
jgi:hypothetical protein